MQLEINGLTKVYGKKIAVNNVSYTMSDGIYGLLGVNGAGKTTLMKMLCTVMKATSGVICCNGTDITKMGDEYRKNIGYLPQDFGCYPYFTGEDYLTRIALLKGLSKEDAHRQVERLLDRVGLSDDKAKKTKTYSGGMLRRLGIAQALINNPRILILDEPTAGLDPNERIRFRNMISDMSEKRIILLSTHIVSDVENIANEIIMMKKGRFNCYGCREKLLDTARIKAWKCTVSGNTATMLKNNYMVVNVKRSSNLEELRILAEENPHPSAMEERLTLEDLFSYYNKGGANSNDTL